MILDLPPFIWRELARIMQKAFLTLAIVSLVTFFGFSTYNNTAVGDAIDHLRTRIDTVSFISTPSVAVAAHKGSDVPAGYHLVWSDEFDGTGLPDSSKWHDDTRANTWDPSNGELEYYTSGRLENEHMEGGYLYLTARKEDMTGQPDYVGQHYSSARIITWGKAGWLYGYFEVRAKMPCGAGTWPAIWMLGTNGYWPTDGEIDIMEDLGRDPNTIYGTVINTGNVAAHGAAARTTVADACGTFHNYELTWTAESLQIGVDGVVYNTYTNAHTGKDQWPFDEAQYFLLNLAMGGSWAGAVDESGLPRSFVVDYVRVYQKSKIK